MSGMDGYRRCPWCALWKLPNRFSPSKRGMDGLQTYCKECRCDRAKQALADGRRKDCPKPGRMGEASSGAWIRPRDDRPLLEKLHDVQARKWRRFDGAEPGQLRACMA